MSSQGRIKLDTHDYGKVEVEVIVITPGLAIHHSINTDTTFSRSSWTVTHMRSGRALAYRRTKEEAASVAQELAELGNWDSPRSRIPKWLKARGWAVIMSGKPL